MGLFEGITHSNEIEEILNEAQRMYDTAVSDLDNTRKETADCLEKLGKLKLSLWSSDMKTFLSCFGKFKNVEMRKLDNQNFDYLNNEMTRQDIIINMENATDKAKELVKVGFLAIGTGALVGIASYGSAIMFAKASTGTAISTLHGIARKNATLAWFGGGVKALNGFGIKGGALTLAGVVLIPTAIVSGVIAAFKGKERLAKAKEKYAEVEQEVTKMNTISITLNGIKKLSNNYFNFLNELSSKFKLYLNKLKSISKNYSKDDTGKVEFNQLSELDKKTLHLSWLFAVVYYNCLATQLMTDNGSASNKAKSLLTQSKKEYNYISTNFTKVEEKQQEIIDKLSLAKKEFYSVYNSLEHKRKNYRTIYSNIGKSTIERWNKLFVPLINILNKFENIEVDNNIISSAFSQNIDDVFENIFSLTNVTKTLPENTHTINSIAYIDISLKGIEAIKDENRSDDSSWFDKGCLQDKEIIIKNIVSSDSICNIIDTLKNATFKIDIREVNKISEKVDSMKLAFEEIRLTIIDEKKVINKQQLLLNKIAKLIILYITEFETIYNEYTQNNVIDTVDFNILKEEDKKVIKTCCNLAKIYYILSNTEVLTYNTRIYDEAMSYINTFLKSSYSMSDLELRTANVIWIKRANQISIINYVSIALCSIISLIQLVNKNMIGLFAILSIIIAFPINFFYKFERSSQLFICRLVRLILALVIELIILIVGLVV